MGIFDPSNQFQISDIESFELNALFPQWHLTEPAPGV